MTREGKTLFLLALTYVLYATSILLSQGAFIFPFPLNGFALFVVTLQLAWWNKNETFAAINVMLIGLTAILGSPPFWEIWLDNETLFYLEDLNFYSILIVLHIFFILSFLGMTRYKKKDPYQVSTSILTTAGIIIGISLSSYLVLSFSFLLIVGSLLIKQQMKGLNWVWAFLLFFNLISFISLEL